MQNLITFQFGQSKVRVIEKDSTPWFVAADVCAILEIGNVSMALSRLDDDEAGITTIDTRSENGVEQRRDVSVVSESGLYALIFTSRKPEAKRFRKWVTSEVLPAIRKAGVYHAKPVTPLRVYSTLIGGVTTLAVDGRELWEALSAPPAFSSWLMRRANRYGFHLGRDFRMFKRPSPYATRCLKEYDVSVDMAHYLAFLERHADLTYFLRNCRDQQVLQYSPQLRLA